MVRKRYYTSDDGKKNNQNGLQWRVVQLGVSFANTGFLVQYGVKGQQHHAGWVHSDGQVSALPLDSQLLVLRKDLRDVAQRTTRPPAGDLHDGKLLRTSYLLLVSHGNGQDAVRERPLPHLE